MADLIRALSISSGILLMVVIFTIFISITMVKRGEISMGGHGHGHHPEPLAEAAVPAGKAAKAGPVSDEISVMNILLLGIGLFTVTVLALLALSFLQHAG